MSHAVYVFDLISPESQQIFPDMTAFVDTHL